MRNEIEARDPTRLAEVTDVAEERAWLRPDGRNTRLRERQKRLNACEIRAKTP
jgi:hypothetical protein